jgi:GDP-4-dehydro-6-deoxy-D-mannose reductase
MNSIMDSTTGKKAFITGITGFVGPYLAECLRKHGRHVIGVDRWEESSLKGIEYHSADILDTAVMSRILGETSPDEIYHLAAISFLPEADASPKIALEINVIGTVSILDAARNRCPDAKVLLVGSSKEYDNTCTNDAIAETVPANPTNFYGISKYVSELVGMQYVRQYGSDIRFSRSFNHTGPGQSPKFVCSDWAKQVAEISLGKREPVITVGDIGAYIDFLDVRDVVEAYVALAGKGHTASVYNVCSGKAVALSWILDYLCSKANTPITIQSARTKLRGHATSQRLVGDNTRIRSHTGWEPAVSLDKTLDELYDYWVQSLRQPQ